MKDPTQITYPPPCHPIKMVSTWLYGRKRRVGVLKLTTICKLMRETFLAFCIKNKGALKLSFRYGYGYGV